jgi:hypothetical protein
LISPASFPRHDRILPGGTDDATRGTPERTAVQVNQLVDNSDDDWLSHYQPLS